MKKRLSINDIFIKIQAAALKNEVNLTYTNKMVFIKLIDYAEENDSIDYPVWTRFNVKTSVLAKYCSVSPRIITESLRKLNQCGIIKYIVQHPNPSVVTLYKKYYEDSTTDGRTLKERRDKK